MKLRIVILLLGIGAVAATHAAGRVLPIRPAIPAVTGSIAHSVVAPDGSVFLSGGFTAIDGVPRPGLAKLTLHGRLDRRFRPETVAGIPRADGDLYGVLALFPGNGQPLFLTQEGTLLHESYNRLLAYRPDGFRDRHFECNRALRAEPNLAWRSTPLPITRKSAVRFAF